MFNQKLKDQQKVLKEENERLEDKILSLKKDLTKVELNKKIGEEDIKHMVKMAKERNGIELEKKIMVVEKEKANEIAAVKDKYRDKLEIRLQSEVENIKEMYGQILNRLPNITAKIKGSI